MKPSATFPSRIPPAAIAAGCFAYFAVAVTVLYFLNPSYSLFRSFTGGYDLHPLEFLIASTFFSLGLGSLALGVGLYKGMSPSVRSRIGALLVSLWGLGMLTAGVFPANEGGSTVPHTAVVLIAGLFPVEALAVPETTFSFIHILALVVSLPLLALGALLLSRRLKQAGNWRPVPVILLVLTSLICIASIVFIPMALFPGFHRYINIDPLVIITTGLVAGIVWLFLSTIQCLVPVESA